MASYLNIINDNQKLIISDTLNIMQPVRSIKGTIDTFTANPVSSTYGVRPLAPYSGVSSQYSTSTFVGSDAAFMAYRIIGDVGNLPYSRVFVKESDTANNSFKLGSHSRATTPFETQVVNLSYGALHNPLENSGMVAYNEQERLIFDASLGTVHHLGSINVKLNVGSDGDKSYLVKDLTGLNLDPARIFIAIRSVPMVSFVEFRSGGSQYRSGWRTWIPRYRVTGNNLYLDLQLWNALNYTGSFDQVYQPIFAASLYYLPNIRL